MNAALPGSIREINELPEAEKRSIYQQLIPPWAFEQLGLDRELLASENPLLLIRCPRGSRAVEISIKKRLREIDPSLYLDMIDTVNNQLMVLMVIINDVDAPRFHVDIDQQGNNTQFGTRGRNIPEELRAMAAGLAPGQVRRGLRTFKAAVPIFEDFVQRMGHELFLIEPLFYHNAITFERYGFAYLFGRREMEQIHQGFLPGGEYHARLLEGGSPFRKPELALSVRGRSWAIHDGILGYPFTGFQMYKRIGVHSGVNTFPDRF
ncbi:MAG: hypothetical protein HC915_08010 [Anaerolineae bacterium]|nr:hypothetical protein [Anaerolineae bacterium]